MSTETIGPKGLIGQLRDTGLSTVLVNRIEELLEAFNMNLDQFCIATRGQLLATYRKTHPGLKSLGAKTYDAFDTFVRLWKQSKYEVKQVAKEAAAEQERKEAERAEMREALLTKEMDSETVLKVLEALERLGRSKKFSLGEMLNLYGMVSGKEA